MSAGKRLAALLMVAAFIAIGLAALAGSAESHDGHPQKKLFSERWHYQPDGDYAAWMNLSTSDVWLNCDGSPAACGAKWDGPFTDSMADWNGQPTTVRFDYTDGVQDEDFDVDVYVEDLVPGGPGLLGFAPTFDINGVPCSSSCVVYSGIVWVGDDAHSGVYGSANDRLASISHEAGHIIQLAHESNPLDCGMDDTGPIPHSVMAYDCIDPVIIGGLGESFVQPWDVCGVNHAYNDPAFGFTGCDLTTTTPTASSSPAASSDVQIVALSCDTEPEYVRIKNFGSTQSLSGFRLLSDSAGGTQDFPLTDFVGSMGAGQTIELQSGPGSGDDAGAGIYKVTGNPLYRQADPTDYARIVRPGTTSDQVNCGSPPNPTPTPNASPTATVTPSNTPQGEVVTWADNNCSQQVDPVDSLFVLRGDAGLPTNTGDCPDMGQDIEVLNASPHIWGDVDCGGDMTPVDSLKILRYDAGLSASQAANCPLMNSQVLVTE